MEPTPPSSNMPPLIPSKPLPKCGDGECTAPEHQVLQELKHTKHNRVEPWVKHLKAVQQDMLDEATALDNEAIACEKMICGLVAAIDNKRKRFMWTIDNVWSPEEIVEAKRKLAVERERMGP